jgi:hypothetical protein
VDYHGSDLIAGGVPGGAKDAQDCCRKCIASAECSFWTWGKDNKKCWVKKTDGGYFGPEGFPTLTPRHQASELSVPLLLQMGDTSGPHVGYICPREERPSTHGVPCRQRERVVSPHQHRQEKKRPQCHGSA